MATLQDRNIEIAVRICFILAGLAALLLVTLLISFGPSISTPFVAGTGVLFLLIIGVIRFGYGDVGRLMLANLPVALTLVTTLAGKIFEPGSSDILYYDSRLILILLSIVPTLIFNLSEITKLYGSLGFTFVVILFFDPIHNYFDVGYYQRGFQGISYYYINYITVFTFLGITGGALTLKKIIGQHEAENRLLQQQLQARNKELFDALQNVETQNEELIAQSEELHASQDQLLAANELIGFQKQELQKQVSEINLELQETNTELVKHINELREFSYTISHNMRGPIARLLGLVNVANLNAQLTSDPEAVYILRQIANSARELDAVVHDLNRITEVRNTIYQTREVLSFDQVWQEVKNNLVLNDEFEKAHIHTDFSRCQTLYSVRPMIVSILNNLVSNAIKFKSPERPLKIRVETFHNNTFTILHVTDNGLGIDLPVHETDLFKMYRRFHVHEEGKGLGLYLVRSQAQALNGFIEVESSVNTGTAFRVFVRNIYK